MKPDNSNSTNSTVSSGQQETEANNSGHTLELPLLTSLPVFDEARKRIPVTVLSGFLGAGKTRC